MDPKQLSEFIARNGRVVGQKTTPRKSLREPETITLEFENGATVTYQPAQFDPESGDEISPQRVVASNEAPNRQSSSANESVSAPPTQPNIVSRKPDGSFDVAPNPNYRPEPKPDGQIVNAGNGRIILVKPDGSRTVIEEGRPVEQKDGTLVNLGKRGVYLIRPDGSSQQVIPADAPEPEKPTMINGKPHVLKDGAYVPVPVGGEPSPGGGPSLDELKLEYGEIVGGLRAYASRLQEALRTGTLSQDEYKARWDEAKALANTRVAEINSTLSTQASIYGQQSANWRQDQATANTRLNASLQTHQLGMQAASQLRGLDPSGTAGMATITGTLLRGHGAAQAFGGYGGGQAPALPVALQRVMSLDLMDDGTIQIKPQATASGGADGAALPAALTSIRDAVNMDVSQANPAGVDLSETAPAPSIPPAALMAVPGVSSLRGEFPDDVLLEAASGLYGS